MKKQKLSKLQIVVYVLFPGLLSADDAVCWDCGCLAQIKTRKLYAGKTSTYVDCCKRRAVLVKSKRPANGFKHQPPLVARLIGEHKH